MELREFYISEYEKFLEMKRKTFLESGFKISESKLNPLLKDFQKFGVKTALFKGKFAFFFDCGLGKTFCQLEWAKQVQKKTKKKAKTYKKKNKKSDRLGFWKK